LTEKKNHAEHFEKPKSFSCSHYFATLLETSLQSYSKAEHFKMNPPLCTILSLQDWGPLQPRYHFQS